MLAQVVSLDVYNFRKKFICKEFYGGKQIPIYTKSLVIVSHNELCLISWSASSTLMCYVRAIACSIPWCIQSFFFELFGHLTLQPLKTQIRMLVSTQVSFCFVFNFLST